MSKLKVTTISDPDNDNTAISIDTSGNITIPNNATFSGTVTGAGGGKVLQVVAATPITSTDIDSGSTYVDIISASITPSSTTSKILMIFSGYIQMFGNNDTHSYYQKVLRNSTELFNSATDQAAMMRSDGAGYLVGQYSTGFIHLDSPSTTSSVTYKVQGNENSDQWFRFKYAQLQLLEIGA